MDAIVKAVETDQTPEVAHPAPISQRSLMADSDGQRASELCGLTRTLSGRMVLDGVSLAIRKGETMSIMGGSGAGKSVTLKHIVGLMKPDRGCVKVDGV